jgi:hypothetical protein
MVKEEPKTGPDYSKFEKWTSDYVTSLATLAPNFRDRVMRVWAKQTEGKKDEQGKGLGSAIYDDAVDFVKKEVYGITEEGKGNEDYQTRMRDIYNQTISLDKSGLEKALGSKNIVHSGDLEGIIDIGSKHLTQNKLSITASKLSDLTEEEQGTFKGYVAKLAKDLGYTKVTEKSLLTHKSAVSLYIKLVKEFAKKELEGKAKAELDLTGAANNTDFEEEAAA